MTLVGFAVQLLLVSRIIQFAGLARALLVTPVAFVAGYLVVGIVPAFLLLQSVLVLQRSFDYSLLNTTRNALLLPMDREAKYQAKTAIDTFFFRAGDLLATASVFLGTRLLDDARTQFVWLIVVLSLSMMAVAWLVGREYARRERAADTGDCAMGRIMRASRRGGSADDDTGRKDDAAGQPPVPRPPARDPRPDRRARDAAGLPPRRDRVQRRGSGRCPVSAW